MAVVSSPAIGFAKNANDNTLSPAWYYSSGEPYSVVSYLFKDSDNNFYVGLYNSRNYNVSSCPSSSYMPSVMSQTNFNNLKNLYNYYGVDTSSWFYNPVNVYSIYFTASVSSYNQYVYEVDVSNPIFETRDIIASKCSSVLTNYSYYLTPKVSISYEESSGSDFSPIVSSILMIPASILVCCFFFIIYRMFMNRKVRG